jgi:methionyl-tRNA formyltransferase
MSIFFASSSSVAIPIAKALIKTNSVTGFISNSDKPSGRNREVQPNGFSSWAAQTNLKVYKPIDDSELAAIVKGSDLIITCSYGKLIKEELLNLPKYGWLNIHFSILPNYRGAAPVQRAIQNGDRESGYTIFKMDTGLDTGEILHQEKIALSPTMKASEYLGSLAESASTKLPEIISNRENWKFRKQVGNSSSAPKITKAENVIAWDNSAEEIFNNYRALDFNGGVHCNFRGEKIEILEMQISDTNLECGALKVDDNRLFVGSGTIALEIKVLKPAGKKAMQVKDWLNGARIISGEKFE